MDIFINGKQGAGKTRAAETLIKNFRPLYGTRLSDADVLYLHDPRDLHSVKLLVEMIRAARVRAVVFDESIHNGAHLLTAVQAVKEYRAQINADILAIYVQQAEVTSAKDIADNMPQLLNGTQDVLDTTKYPQFKGDLSPYATSGKLADTIKPAQATPEQAKQFAEDWRKSFDTLPVLAKGDRIPVTYDEATKSYTAASLMEGDRILVEAVNVFAFKGALRLGLGHRENVSMLFELAEVIAVSELHVAVDKMNTHYFATGRFEKRAFNAKNCRPATPAEVIEYLNAKLKYQNSL